MVLDLIKKVLAQRKKNREEELAEEQRAEEFRHSEDLRHAQALKREADRLAHLKQYESALPEYEKSLAAFPYKKTDNLYGTPANLLFKLYFNMGVAHYYTNNLKQALSYFDKALELSNVDDDNVIKALESRGNCYYFGYRILKEPSKKFAIQNDVSNPTKEWLKKQHDKHSLIERAHSCYEAMVEIDPIHADAWYAKGHMEVLLKKTKEAVQSFDKLLGIQENHANKDKIALLDEIKREKGIAVATPLASHTKQTAYKTKTGHFVDEMPHKIIADYLFDQGIVFQYKGSVAWSPDSSFTSLFFLPKLQVYLEHVGRETNPEVQSRVAHYTKHNQTVLVTSQVDESQLEDVLHTKLKPHIKQNIH